jgi:hypothetical protein
MFSDYIFVGIWIPSLEHSLPLLLKMQIKFIKFNLLIYKIKLT